MNSEIPVVFYFDNNYVIQASVTFYSIMENANKDYFYKFFVLHTDITEENQAKLFETIKDFKNVSLEFINMENRLDDLWNKLKTKGHFTKETFYKMLTASIFPQYDKVITTDVDVVFLGDIAPSYFELQENEDNYIAGVKPVGKIMWYYDNYKKSFSDKEIEKMAICGGYLVMNLKKIREDKMENKFMKCFKDNAHRLNQAEQDILNLCCYPKIKYLPLKNLVCSYVYDYYNAEEDFENDSQYSKEELIDAYNNPIQLHYATSIKPWNIVNATKSDEWFKYLVKTPFLQEYLNTLPDKIQLNACNKLNAVKEIKGTTSFDIEADDSGVRVKELMNLNFNLSKDKKITVKIDKLKPPLKTMFIKDIIRILNKNRNNNLRDLHYIPSFKKTEKRKSSNSSLYDEKSIKEFFDLDKIYFSYKNLGDKISQKLFKLLIAYKIAGPTEIRLPLYNKKIWKDYKRLNKLVTAAGSEQSLIGPFNYYDLRKLGFNLDLYYAQFGVFLTYCLKQYEYGDICKVKEGDYVIDGGACFGDSALYFADLAGKNGKVFSFEFVENNIEIFNKNLDLNPKHKKRIELIERPIGKNSTDKLYGTDNGPGSSISTEYSENSKEYTTMSIDDMVEQKNVEKIDFIKLDIEGSEVDTLQGAEKTIKKFRPKLAISIYHKDDDFITIPALLKQINPNYKFYVGHYTVMNWETVLFAVDRES